MQILMIGNGFDIEHRLPTQYKDFLQFIEEFTFIYGSQEKFSEIDSISDKNKKEFFNKIFSDEKNIVCNKLYGNVNHNIWIDYFQKNLRNMKQNWIDFESEISKIIILLEKSKIEYDKETYISSQKISSPEIYDILIKELYNGEQDSKETLITGKRFSILKDELLHDLNRLINALEIYLAEYVANLRILTYNKSIEKLSPTHIITFNYTNTYETVYNIGWRNIEYDFIHGKAIKTNENFCNMVLGIDEYLSEKERQNNIEFVEFQKYYQRMQKKTECKYTKWKEKIEEEKHNHRPVKLYIFGHSLDITDKDVLREFLLNDNIITTIFYYNQDAYERQLANLIKLLDPNELALRVYGKNPKIKFKQQEKSFNISNSEFDITNDIRQIHKLQEYSNKEIENILKKISDKIQNSDKEYFCSQEKIISMYDALVKWEICTKEQREKLLQMAKEMASSEEKYYHNIEKWYDYDFTGEYQCARETINFVDDINLYNKEQFHCVSRNVEQLSDIEFINEYKNRADLSEDEFVKILDRVFLSDDVDYMWKEIGEIADKNIQVARNVIKKRKRESISEANKIRLKFILECCAETEYYRQQQLVYEENQEYW